MKCTEKILQKWWKMVEKGDLKRIAGQTPTAGVETLIDLPYVEDGNKYHLLDVYRPEGAAQRLPTIVNIHGGGWLYGTKEINKYFNMYLAAQGFTVVSINYILAPDTTLYGQIDDCFKAFEWVSKNDGNYGIDVSRCFVTGDSAGGHLAMLAGFISNSEQLQKLFAVKKSLSFLASGLICPATDISGFVSKRLPILSTYMKMVLGKGYRTDERVQYVSVGKLTEIAKCPPTFFISCYGDFLKGQVNKAEAIFKQSNLPHEYHYVAEKSENDIHHVFNVTNPEYSESIKANDAMCQYFRSFL